MHVKEVHGNSFLKYSCLCAYNWLYQDNELQLSLFSNLKLFCISCRILNYVIRFCFISISWDVDIDDCYPDPCQNYGSCTDRINDYDCSCIPSYTGKNCTEFRDPCIPNPCGNNGTCMNDTKKGNLIFLH